MVTSKDRHTTGQEPSGQPVAARELGEVLDLLAHDLKNPLAAIMTNVAFVKAWLSSIDPQLAEGIEDIRDAISDAAQAGDAVQRYVGNLEMLAREIDEARVRVEVGPIDLSSLMDEAMVRNQEGAAGRHLSLTFQPPDHHVWARADRELVVRALDNVLANAIQHAPRRSKIELLVSSDGPDATLTVLDEGVRVPPELRPLAASYRGQGKTKNHPEGRYGRGLSLLGAAIAARLTGGSLDLGEQGNRCAIQLILPRLGEHESPRPPFAVADIRHPS